MKPSFFLIGMLFMAAPAMSEDWTVAEDGVQVDGQTAFPGCAPSRSEGDLKALKISTLRAEANIARSKNKEVSGSEQLSGDKKDQYKISIYETNEAYMDKVTVIDKKMTDIDGVRQLCVLVIGDASLEKTMGREK